MSEETGRSRPNPIDSESPFHAEELFFSRTDTRGVILSGNSVFERVSKYGFDELIGHPHNIIRHPDMPRAVFRLLWDYLKSDRPVAAYVKNMSKDGSFYWVMAHVAPVGNEYLSIRLKPTSEIFPEVERLYKELRELERHIEQAATGSLASRREEAIAQCETLLSERLSSLGFSDYTSFMNTALPTEVTSRDRRTSESYEHNAPSGSMDGAVDATRSTMPISFDVYQDLAGAYSRLRSVLDGFLANIDTYASLDTTLAPKSRFLENLGEDMRLFALNAILACEGLGSHVAALTAVASLMRDRSNLIGQLVGQLTKQLSTVSGVLKQIGFQIASSRLQNEQGARFVEGLLRGNETSPHVLNDLHVLTNAQRGGLTPLRRALITLDEQVGDLLSCAHSVERELKVMQVLHVNGRVESAGVPDNSAIVALFQTIGDKVRTALAEMTDFALLDDLATDNYLSIDAQINAELEEIDNLLGKLSVGHRG